MKPIMYRFLTVACLLASAPILCSVEKEPIANYQVLFSPGDHIADELISLIAAEKKSIKAAVYSLMHGGIAKALVDAHNRGVHVEVIVDPYSLKSHTTVKKMGAAHLPIFVWSPPARFKESKDGRKIRQRTPLMHDKFCVLGNSRVWTGSFNFTLAATSANRENVVVLESTQIASRYLDEFEKLKKTGCISLSDYLSEKNEK
jgi:phosphatidylserine/phosphatidylglycerophosphate/cardiolipin synthase-like enzyme